ncbi:MAG: aminotransferase class I/II-fold pyridoxal phosphate-dependent enzyme [Syntrophobacteraceae bacterium]
MKIADFKLEGFFNQYEFSAPHLLAQSDCESMTVRELLSLEEGAAERFQECWLGYTEVEGGLPLRREIAGLYTSLSPEDILVHVGAQEAIFAYMNVVLEPGDYVICQFPTYQSLYEVARAIGCRLSRWELRQDEGGWQADVEELAGLIRPETRLIIINSPNNPTGYELNTEERQAIVEIARKAGIAVFSDEVYKDLAYDGKRLPWFADLYENAVSLGVMSKAYGLAGLRVGWVATRNRELYEKMARFKHYLTICSSAPSEFLATLALRQGPCLLARNLEIIQANLAESDRFFAEYASLFQYNRPLAGPIAFHRVHAPVEEFCSDLRKAKGVLLLPGSVYDYPGNYFRMGYGRRDFPTCLGLLREYLAEKGLG